MYCKFGNFCEGLFSRNFANVEFREIKTFAKWRKLFALTDVDKSCSEACLAFCRLFATNEDYSMIKKHEF